MCQINRHIFKKQIFNKYSGVSRKCTLQFTHHANEFCLSHHCLLVADRFSCHYTSFGISPYNHFPYHKSIRNKPGKRFEIWV